MSSGGKFLILLNGGGFWLIGGISMNLYSVIELVIKPIQINYGIRFPTMRNFQPDGHFMNVLIRAEKFPTRGHLMRDLLKAEKFPTNPS